MDLAVDLRSLGRAPRPGDSIALSGVCCTATRLDGGVGHFRLSAETLERTWLADVEPGQALNLEAALRVGDALGGHLVQGHVDGVGEVMVPIDPELGGELAVRLPAELLRYCALKGSLALDGISLTVAGLAGDRVTIAVIPHTARMTTLGERRAGHRLNVEVDILAKYVERLLGERGA
jgi:riboflavin synthase